MSKILLKPYQQQILDELAYLPSIALFMGTGSGKTYTSLFRVKDNPTNNLLVVCPANITEQWENSINEILPEYKVLQFPKRSSAVKKNKMIREVEGEFNAVIVSLNILFKLESLLLVLDDSWTIIIDESHKIKDMGTNRNPVKVTRMALRIGECTPYKILLTATPTQKEYGGYIDYYSQLRFLGYTNIPLKQFEDRYCKIQKIVVPGNPYPIPVIVGYKNTDELDSLLSVVARRYVPKFREDGDPVYVKVNIEKAKNYQKFEKERFYEELSVQNLTAMRIARKTLTGGVIAGRDMFGEPVKYQDNTHKIDWVEEFLSNTDETVVIFYKYNVELEQLKALVEKMKLPHIVINGANQNKIHDIKNKEYKVVLGQINACGESIDGLQYKSHLAVYYSMPESSLEYTQSLGRIDRIGQENVPVYYHLVMNGTIDDDIYKMTMGKIEFNERVLNKLNIDFEMEDGE